MNPKTVALVVVSLITGFTLAAPVSAQEGHPMVGSWVGDWGTSPTERNRVVIVMEWTGTELVGDINPGPNAIPINATVDTEDWTLHIEAEGRDAEGRALRYVIEGAIDDLGTYNRTIAGTWSVGDTEGSFSITRQ